MQILTPRIIILFFLIASASISIYSQQVDYGIVVLYNNASQTNYDPTIPEDGEFQWNSLGTWGGGAFISKSLSPKFATRIAALYQQKGYQEYAQVGYIPQGPIYDKELQNSFNYLSIDLSIQYRITNAPSLRTFINFGLEYSYLLDYEIESDFWPVNNFYPVNAYDDKWETHTISMLPSVSLTFAQATTLEFGFNRSISPNLKVENLIVKDWIWTVRLNQSVPALFKRTS